MLFSPEHLTLFLGAAILVTVSPGPDNLATLSIGLSRGWRSAVGFGVGCGCGCLFHTALAAAGVSALLRSSPAAFSALKWCGAAYLAWLGFGALRSQGSRINDFAGDQESGLRYFSRGLFANAINPKVAVFFLSFLPQFVVESSGRAALQMLLLGLIFTAQAMLIFAAIGCFSGQIGQALRSHLQAGVWLDRFTGILFIGLAVRLAIL